MRYGKVFVNDYPRLLYNRPRDVCFCACVCAVRLRNFLKTCKYLIVCLVSNEMLSLALFVHGRARRSLMFGSRADKLSYMSSFYCVSHVTETSLSHFLTSHTTVYITSSPSIHISVLTSSEEIIANTILHFFPWRRKRQIFSYTNK